MMDPSPAATLTILHAPGYGPVMHRPDIVHQAESTKADSIGYSEGYKIAGRVLHNRPRYDAVVGRSKVDTRRIISPMGDAGDTPIAVRDDHHISERRAYRVTHPGPLPVRKWSPERWLTVATYDWREGGQWVTHINVHPSPLFTGRRKWRRVMDAAIREARKAKAAGRLVVVTGDMNSRAAGELLAKAGLEVWQVGIDYIGYDERLKLVGRREIRVPDLDHPWMLGTFVKRAA